MKKVLILGAGLVARPIIVDLLHEGFMVTVASPMKERADEMIDNHPLGSSVFWTMDDREMLGKLVSGNDITVSLLPFKLHADVARTCLLYRKSLVTTSYVQPEMAALDIEAKEAGVLFLNEIGLDPGIDHMSAMRIINQVHSQGGRISEFYSVCGALPAPEAANNLFRYKFSWSPKGVILASRNSALYKRNGIEIRISGEHLFKDRIDMDFPGIGSLEVYPNRDSVSYIDIYGIQEARTVYRGTFRYKGWCEILDFMKSINMLDTTIMDYSGIKLHEFIARIAGLKGADVKMELCEKKGVKTDNLAIRALEWLGFFDKRDLNYGKVSPFDITSDIMIPKMSLSENERDMVALLHIIHVEYPDGSKKTIRSSMLDFGSPSTDTSVARTVSLPAAIAVKLILENKIKLTGVHRPVLREIYEPVLQNLSGHGITINDDIGK